MNAVDPFADANYIFNHAEEINCPACSRKKKYQGKSYRNAPRLMKVEDNYSGSGIDVGQCPDCGRSWGIYYQVRRMERWVDWDGQTREEVIAYQKQQDLKEADRLEAKAKELRSKVTKPNKGAENEE